MTNYISFRGTALQFCVCIYCEMSTTVSLVNVRHRTLSGFFFSCDENSEDGSPPTVIHSTASLPGAACWVLPPWPHRCLEPCAGRCPRVLVCNRESVLLTPSVASSTPVLHLWQPCSSVPPVQFFLFRLSMYVRPYIWLSLCPTALLGNPSHTAGFHFLTAE